MPNVYEGDQQMPDEKEGMVWGDLFLPTNTGIRTKYYQQYKYAEVIGDKIIYQGESFPSVSKAISYMRGGTAYNAWKVAEVSRPSDSGWIHASDLRGNRNEDAKRGIPEGG